MSALVAAAPHVPDGWMRAWTVADAASHPCDRALWLIPIAPHVPNGWTHVVRSAELIPKDDPTDSRARALVAAAPHVPDGWTEAVLAVAETRYEKDRAYLIAEMTRAMPQELFSHVLHFARAIKKDEYRCVALAALASRAPELIMELNWRDFRHYPPAFDLLAKTETPLAGRIAFIRRELSAAEEPDRILRLVASLHEDGKPWEFANGGAADLMNVVETLGGRWL